MDDPSRIRDYLAEIASLDRFWILRDLAIQPGLIHYADASGKAWVLMDDDDDRVCECIDFLESIGCPVFDDHAQMRDYAKRFERGLGPDDGFDGPGLN